MRSPALTVLFIAAALFSENVGASAQSSGSHPVCAIYYGIDADGTPACTFDTRQQCMETISGIGGFCVGNQYYQGVVAPPPRRRHGAGAHQTTRLHRQVFTCAAGRC
jgi:Protein of unknown function (DUF3551)